MEWNEEELQGVKRKGVNYDGVAIFNRLQLLWNKYKLRRTRTNDGGASLVGKSFDLQKHQT